MHPTIQTQEIRQAKLDVAKTVLHSETRNLRNTDEHLAQLRNDRGDGALGRIKLFVVGSLFGRNAAGEIVGPSSQEQVEQKARQKITKDEIATIEHRREAIVDRVATAGRAVRIAEEELARHPQPASNIRPVDSDEAYRAKLSKWQNLRRALREVREQVAAGEQDSGQQPTLEQITKIADALGGDDHVDILELLQHSDDLPRLRKAELLLIEALQLARDEMDEARAASEATSFDEQRPTYDAIQRRKADAVQALLDCVIEEAEFAGQLRSAGITKQFKPRWFAPGVDIARTAKTWLAENSDIID